MTAFRRILLSLFVVFATLTTVVTAETSQSDQSASVSTSDQSSQNSQSDNITTSSVDQLFDTNTTTTTTAQQGDASQMLQTFHSQPLTTAASLTAEVGGIFGYNDGKDSNGNYNNTLQYQMTPGFYLVPSFTLTARPDESFRFQTTVYGTYTSMFTPLISEMFFDYTLLDRVFFRIGKYSLSWGSTRLYSAGDLMNYPNLGQTSPNSGLAFKANLPLGAASINGVVLTPSGLAASNFTWHALTFGGQADIPFWKSDLIVGATYSKSSSPSTWSTATLKTSLFNVDLFAEAIGSYDDPTKQVAFTGALSGFFYEHSDPHFKLYGEYYLDARDTSYRSDYASAVFHADSILGSPFDFGIQWAHAFIDNSGIVSPGFSVSLCQDVSLDFGFPIRYGAAGSYYLLNQMPTVDETTTVSDVLSWNQRYGFMFKVKLSVGF